MSASPRSRRRFCPAKLNLGLRIVGRRADGYHLLDTLFHAIDLGDDLVAAPGANGPTLEVRADDPRDLVPAGPDNLVLRAARAFALAVARPVDVAFALHKRVPSGAGLGGGSSDAAGALLLCNEIAGSPLASSQLADLARGLGADVPFFLRGGSQWGTGVGDQLEPAAVPAAFFTLVIPPFGCPTAEVYKNFSAHWHGPFDAATIRLPRPRHHKDFAVGDRFVNDLQAAAERIRPELGALRHRVETLAGTSFSMTGSGAVLFAEARDAGHRDRIVAALAPLAADGVRVVAAASAERGAGDAAAEAHR